MIVVQSSRLWDEKCCYSGQCAWLAIIDDVEDDDGRVTTFDSCIPGQPKTNLQLVSQGLMAEMTRVGLGSC